MLLPIQSAKVKHQATPALQEEAEAVQEEAEVVQEEAVQVAAHHHQVDQVDQVVSSSFYCELRTKKFLVSEPDIKSIKSI